MAAKPEVRPAPAPSIGETIGKAREAKRLEEENAKLKNQLIEAAQKLVDKEKGDVAAAEAAQAEAEARLKAAKENTATQKRELSAAEGQLAEIRGGVAAPVEKEKPVQQPKR